MNNSQRLITHVTVMLLGLMVVIWFGWHAVDIYAWATPGVNYEHCPPDSAPCTLLRPNHYAVLVFIAFPIAGGLGLLALSIAGLAGRGTWADSDAPQFHSEVTAVNKPYHRYVFNSDSREFIGDFEGMYQSEIVDRFDSWSHEDLTTVSKTLTLALLNRHAFPRILDIGCGKGSLTHLLGKVDNHVIGIDIAPTAIEAARTKYPTIQFEVLPASDIGSLNQEFDLVLVCEVLSYLKDWREVLGGIANITQYLYVTLFLPPDPIGFVASFAELRAEIDARFVVETEILIDQSKLCILAVKR